MSDAQAVEPTPVEPEPTNQPTNQPAPEPVPAEPQPTQEEPQSVDSLPDWAQKLIADTRREAADNRVKAKQAEEVTRDSVLAAVNKALGIETETAPTVDDLTQTLTSREQENQALRLEHSLYVQAVKQHVDPDMLTDSRSFMQAMHGIDPTDADAISAAITEHVNAHPQIFNQPQAGASSIDQPGQAPGQVTPEQFRQMNVQERTDLYRNNPTEYARLTGRAES